MDSDHLTPHLTTPKSETKGVSLDDDDVTDIKKAYDIHQSPTFLSQEGRRVILDDLITDMDIPKLSQVLIELKKDLDTFEDPSNETDSSKHCQFCYEEIPSCDKQRFMPILIQKAREHNKDGMLSNQTVRFFMYKLFTSMKYGVLGKGNRVRVSACVEATIRECYPNEEDVSYVGFKRDRDEDSDSDEFEEDKESSDSDSSEHQILVTKKF